MIKDIFKILILILNLIIINFTYAALPAGDGDFTKIDIGAKGDGMCKAYLTLVNDGSATQWNPAALGWITKKEFYFNHQNLFGQNITHAFLGVLSPLPWGALEIGVIALRPLDNFPKYNRYNEIIGDFNLFYSALLLSYGFRFNRNNYLGVTTKTLYKTIDTFNAWGFGLDLAYTMKVESFALAVMTQDLIKPMMKFQQGSESFRGTTATTLRLGVSYTFNQRRSFSIGIDRTVGIAENKYYLGYQDKINDMVSLRAGISNITVAAGITIRIGLWEADYSIQALHPLGNQHNISLNVKF